MVNLAVVGLRPARKGEAISMYFVACVKRVSFGTDFMANLTIVCLGLTMERNQPAVCLLWEGSEFMVDSTVVVLGLAIPSACVWFVACVNYGPKFREGFPGQLNVSGSGTGRGENPPACILVVWEGSEFTVNSTEVGLLQD